ncbi:hypothetical protein [Candidatus Pyrohabitans sp.]
MDRERILSKVAEIEGGLSMKRVTPARGERLKIKNPAANLSA